MIEHIDIIIDVYPDGLPSDLNLYDLADVSIFIDSY